MPYSTITLRHADDIADDYRAGLSLSKLAAKWGGSANLHHRILISKGVRMRGKNSRKPDHSRSRAFAQRIASGEKIAAVAMEYGIANTTAYQWCRRHGVKSRGMDAIRERKQATRQAIIRMWHQGLGHSEIARNACASKSTIRRALQSSR